MITGVSSSIGLATTGLLASRDNQLTLVARNEEKWQMPSRLYRVPDIITSLLI